MGDAGAAFGSGMNFMSDRIAEQHEANQRDIDRKREDYFNRQQQMNWQAQFDENRMIDRRNFQYQKELNETQMMREDNATQRKVKDLEAAGMNKLLAIGQEAASGGMTTYGGNVHGGNSGGGVSEFSPTGFMSKGVQIMDDLVKQSAISKSAVENEYTAQKILTEKENTLFTRYKALREEYAKTTDKYLRDKIKKEMSILDKELDVLEHNLGIGRKNNLPVGTDPTPNNPIAATYRALTYGSSQASNEANKVIEEKVNKDSISKKDDYLSLNSAEEREFRNTLKEHGIKSKKELKKYIKTGGSYEELAKKTGISASLLQSFMQYAWW